MNSLSFSRFSSFFHLSFGDVNDFRCSVHAVSLHNSIEPEVSFWQHIGPVCRTSPSIRWYCKRHWCGILPRFYSFLSISFGFAVFRHFIAIFQFFLCLNSSFKKFGIRFSFFLVLFYHSRHFPHHELRSVATFYTPNQIFFLLFLKCCCFILFIPYSWFVANIKPDTIHGMYLTSSFFHFAHFPCLYVADSVHRC